MKQTAIDWAIKKAEDEIHIYGGEGSDVMIEFLAILKQAKQLEKEQMIEFAEDYIDYHCYADFDNQITYDKTATEYFNETYKGGNND